MLGRRIMLILSRSSLLEAQVAEAAKNVETAVKLSGEIAELQSQGEGGRIDSIV